MNKISVNLTEDKSACIDRLMRAMACGFNFNSGAFTAVMHLIASAAMGRVVHESDIIERTRAVNIARQTLHGGIKSIHSCYLLQVMDGDAELDALLAQHPAARAAYERRIERLRFVHACLMIAERYVLRHTTCRRTC